MSVITLSTRVLPRDDQNADPALVAGTGLSRVADELRQATRITAVTATSITFKLADRNADGSDESVVYAWNGTPGSPLTRTYNSGTAETIVDNVRSLAFTADTIAATRAGTPGSAEGAEQLLDEYNPSSTGSGGGTAVSTASYPGMYVRPVLPADATAWRPTRFLFKADKETGGRSTTLNIRKTDASRRPLIANLYSTSVTSSTADNNTWRTVPLTSFSSLTPTEGLAFILTSTALQGSTNVYPDSGALTSNAAFILSTTVGASWTFTKSSAFPFRIYGCVTRPTATTTAYTRCDRVEIRFRVNSDSAAELRTSVALPARPEVG